MQWIKRFYELDPSALFKKGKVVILYGARRVGKTMLMEKLLAGTEGKIFKGSGDDFELVAILSSRKIETYRLFFSPYSVIFIDEAQYVPNIGACAKLLIDLFPEKSVILTGSSAFNLSQTISEPLTGRSIQRFLFPVSLMELKLERTDFQIFQDIESYLIFGMYPEVLSLDNALENTEYLVNLRNSYLFKDILALEHIRNSQKLQDIVRLLAFQIGNEVSLNEIAVKSGLSKNTVERYIDLLEKAFVIKKISAFSRNLRNEISKSAKYYFWDTGIRNAVINDFRPIELRNDLGALWENFVVMELMKKYEYQRRYASFYFWRTYDQKELDLVIDENGRLSGYEIKWRDDTAKIPQLWIETYKGPTWVITKENLLKIMSEETKD
ncbi:MAG: ATP-binding protein [Rectinema sp.]